MIPPYDALMPRVLRHCAEQVWVMKDLIARITDELRLTQDERDQMLPSGVTTVIASRVHWAKTYLKQAGLLNQPKHGVVEISERGREVLSANPEKIDVKLLEQFEEFRAFQNRTRPNGGSPADGGSAPPVSPVVPEDQIATATKILDEALRDALLARVLAGSPAFFEGLIIDLLQNMGYGGGREDAGKQLGQTGDGGVDGVIDEDRLGLDRIYLQAKRYQPENKIGSPAVYAFIGALVGKGAHKGVFITTSSFTEAAKEAARQSGSSRLVLIDGEELTSLMVRFNVGVRLAQRVEIKRVDLDYFEVAETE